MSGASIEVRPLTQHIGAELRGLDLARGLDDGAFGALHAALLEHHVVFVPDQFLDPAALLAVGSRFGTIDVNRSPPRSTGSRRSSSSSRTTAVPPTSGTSTRPSPRRRRWGRS